MVKAFQETFVQHAVPNLLKADSKLEGVINIDDQKALLINNIGILGTKFDRWEDFISNSEEYPPRVDDPKQVAQTAFKDKIKDAIAKENVPNVDADQILVRAGATSCGGCHNFSSFSSEIGKDSAGGKIMWPGAAPGGFAHINEKSELSDLLKDFFLADRCEKMNEIFFKPEGEPASIVPAPNVLSMKLRQASTAQLEALFDLQKNISSMQLEPGLKETLEPVLKETKEKFEQIIEKQSDALRADDRRKRGAHGQIRHAD
jgi:hypothetical protein